MIELIEINAQNYPEAARLSVSDEQQRFLDTAQGILARGYVYRGDNARVLGIAADGRLVGLLLCRDLDEEPACYDLQQFMVDRRHQRRGYGAAALRLLLALLARERQFENVEVCVDRDNAPALGLFTAAGFVDTGYIDPEVPHCVNLRYRLK